MCLLTFVSVCMCVRARVRPCVSFLLDKQLVEWVMYISDIAFFIQLSSSDGSNIINSYS